MGVFLADKHSPDAGRRGIECWPSVRLSSCIVLLSKASECLTLSHRTRAEHCSSVRCSVTSVGSRASLRQCTPDAKERPMGYSQTRSMPPQAVSKLSE